MRSQQERMTEENKRLAGKTDLPTTLPSVPVPIRNDNQEWARKFKLAKYPSGNPFGFDEDTHH